LRGISGGGGTLSEFIVLTIFPGLLYRSGGRSTTIGAVVLTTGSVAVLLLSIACCWSSDLFGSLFSFSISIAFGSISVALSAIIAYAFRYCCQAPFEKLVRSLTGRRINVCEPAVLQQQQQQQQQQQAQSTEAAAISCTAALPDRMDTRLKCRGI
jgi:sensor histidine kinase YesM